MYREDTKYAFSSITYKNAELEKEEIICRKSYPHPRTNCKAQTMTKSLSMCQSRVKYIVTGKEDIIITAKSPYKSLELCLDLSGMVLGTQCCTLQEHIDNKYSGDG